MDDDFNDEEKTKQTNDRLNEIISQTELKSKTFCGSKDPEVDLNSLIGLDNIKEELKNSIAEFEFDKKRAEQGISIEHNLGNHMMFLGAPGTGKTTVAHIMTGILYKYGYIKENKIVDINAADLTAQYTGWTKERTKQIINSAKGGVLFLDEAYILHSKNQLGNSYNEEATSVLVKEMEDNRSEFVVIIAGYKNETLEWINSNPGLRSRFTYTFEFQNYSEDDCCAIFKKIAKDNYFECSDKFMIYYKAYIKMLKDFGQTDFSLIGGNKRVPFQNARQPRVDFQKIKRYHSRNYYAYNYEEDITSLFVKEDAKCLDEMLWEKCGLPNRYIVYGNGENLPK